MTSIRPTTPDDLYEIILSMHEGLNEKESELANAKLIIALVDHIRDRNIVNEAVTIARENTLKQRKG